MCLLNASSVAFCVNGSFHILFSFFLLWWAIDLLPHSPSFHYSLVPSKLRSFVRSSVQLDDVINRTNLNHNIQSLIGFTASAVGCTSTRFLFNVCGIGLIASASKTSLFVFFSCSCEEVLKVAIILKIKNGGYRQVRCDNHCIDMACAQCIGSHRRSG